MALILDEAKRIIEGAIAKAQELNIKISVAVCEAGGCLIALKGRKEGKQWEIGRSEQHCTGTRPGVN